MTRLEVRDLIVAELGEPFAYSYFDRSNFIGGRSPMLCAWSKVADERWRTIGAPFLKRHNIAMGARMEPDRWRDLNSHLYGDAA